MTANVSHNRNHLLRNQVQIVSPLQTDSQSSTFFLSWFLLCACNPRIIETKCNLFLQFVAAFKIPFWVCFHFPTRQREWGTDMRYERCYRDLLKGFVSLPSQLFESCVCVWHMCAVCGVVSSFGLFLLLLKQFSLKLFVANGIWVRHKRLGLVKG